MKKLLIVGAILCFVMPMYGKDLTGRFGVGSELLLQNLSVSPLLSMSYAWNAVSIRTYLSPTMGLGGTFALESVADNTTLGLGANFFYVVAAEQSVNLLAKIGFNMGLGEGDNDIFSFPVVLNAEFFIDKLSNLGIDLGVGLLHIDIVDDDLGFHLGKSALAPTLGFHYYF